MKLFECIIDDGNNVFKSKVAARNKKELLSVYGGNGDFVKIKDITNEYFTHQSVDILVEDLHRCGWGNEECIILKALLQQHIETLKS